MDNAKHLFLNGRKVAFDAERNLLEVIRNAGIELPTFCYHSELSVYGACRLCIVDIEGRGIVTSCSTRPEPGLHVRTSTEELRQIRRISLELLLANHNQTCTSCSRSASCKLQSVARALGVTEVRFKSLPPRFPVDVSSAGLVRDPNKCILCGDCVRACSEIQGIGAIDFAYRGHDMMVVPSFGKSLSDVSCVECGQCARVCPTGALTPRSDTDKVWQALEDPTKRVVVQVAPAVRVALGEMFGVEPGTDVTGPMVAALRRLGFHKVFDTSFAADLTVMEETAELLKRMETSAPMPLITSCCPGWVKFAEYYFPQFLPNLSTCKSPQQMFGAVAKRTLPSHLGVAPEDLVVVSVMPCTAKKGEAARPEFAHDAGPDVDIVITTQELGAMILQAGLVFKKLPHDSFDLPLGFKTGAGVIFGASGGVSEAVLRYAAEKVAGRPLEQDDVREVRGENGIRQVTVALGDTKLRLAVVHGLRNARHLLNEVRKGKVEVDFIEVMACPAGCIGGAGQPVYEGMQVRKERTRGLYRSDKALQLHRAQDNPYVAQLYQSTLERPGGPIAHALLHTEYTDRSEMFEGEVQLSRSNQEGTVEVKVCLGAQCLARGSDDLLQKLVDYVTAERYLGQVLIVAHTKADPCEHPIMVTVDDEEMSEATFDAVRKKVEERLESLRVAGGEVR